MRKVWQDEPDACLRACVAMVLDLDYREVPYIPAVNNRAFWGRWLCFWEIENVAVTFIPQVREFPEGPWIAVVPSRIGSAPSRHAIVCEGAKLFHDPAREAPPYKRRPRNIVGGILLERLDA